MSIIEAALIILISIIVNGVATLLVLKYYLMRTNLKPFIRMAKQFASQMGTKSQEVQHETRNLKLAKQAKQKFVNGAIQELPMGGLLKKIMDSQHISSDEVFAVLQDQNFIKGIKVIINTFSGIADRITGKGESEQGKEQNIQQQFNY
jgi:hypothetical protein